MALLYAVAMHLSPASCMHTVHCDECVSQSINIFCVNYGGEWERGRGERYGDTIDGMSGKDCSFCCCWNYWIEIWIIIIILHGEGKSTIVVAEIHKTVHFKLTPWIKFI